MGMLFAECTARALIQTKGEANWRRRNWLATENEWGCKMGANILVVDDDLPNRELISKVLRIDGHRVVEACDGALALEILRALSFDLVVTDFVMPKLNGLKFVEELHSLHPRFPILFITGYLSVISDKTMLNDVAAILPKPFGLDVLRSTVQRLLINSASC
jgi:CheY-like chemotaxis protein